MKSYKAKNVILANLGLFRGFWTPCRALGTQREFFRKIFYSTKLEMKIQLAPNFQKKLIDGYRALVRTHARTDGRTQPTENNGSSPINRGTNITVFNGDMSLSSFGLVVWNEMLPDSYKQCEDLSTFKRVIKNWVPECNCRLCKYFIKDLGFVNVAN